MATPPIPFLQVRTVLGKHIKLSTYPVIEILLKAISGWFSRPFVVKFFVISIISFEEIIEKKVILMGIIEK